MPDFFSIYALFLIYFQERLLLISFRVRMILSWLLVLYMAVKNRKINPKGIIFHSDRGAQFTSKVFRDYLDSLDMIRLRGILMTMLLWRVFSSI